MLNKIYHPVSVLIKKPILFRACHNLSIGKLVSSSKTDLPKPLTVKGWVKSFRKQKQNTFIDLGDGLSGNHLQIVANTDLIPNNLNFHSCVTIDGTLVPSSHPKQEVELQADKVTLINNCNENYPFQPRSFAHSKFVRKHPGCKAKTNSVSSLLRIRNVASQAVHQFFQSEEFLQIHTPILTSNDCEGGGEVFKVTPPPPQNQDEGPYWDKPVHLTVSGQLHLEAICNGVSKVYTFNPAFRAERGRTRRHLSEFWMIEAEMAFVDDLQVLINTMESLLKHIATKLLEKSVSDLELYARATKGKSNVNKIEEFIKSKVVVLNYSEAVELISREKTLGPLVGGDLGRDHEQWLCGHAGGHPVAVVNWPRDIKPFYMRAVTDDSSFVSGVDLLVPFVGELCGGSLREHCYETLVANIGTISDLEWYLEMRQQGAAQTGGFGLGFERLLQYLIGVENIKDTLPFHRSPHNCSL